MTEQDLPDVPAAPIESEPKHWTNRDGNHELLIAALADAGVEPGAYDHRIADWLAGWETATVLTIASWVRRASAGGRA